MTRLRLAALRYDLFAAINRLELHGDQRELALLVPEQIDLYHQLADARDQNQPPRNPQ